MPTTINEQIKVLVELQKIDGEIFHLRKELLSHPELQKKNDADFEKKKTNLKTSENELKTLQVKQKEKENDLLSREDKIAKLQGQLYQLKTNKEYSAMELEIKSLKADKSVLEEDILRLLDVVDQAKGACVKEKELLSGEEKLYKEASEALKKKSADIQAEIQALEEKRKTYTPNIEPRLLAQYEKILKNREGLALVPVKGNACGGCHLGLPPQVVNEIMIHDKLVVCESCTRILYWVS